MGRGTIANVLKREGIEPTPEWGKQTTPEYRSIGLIRAALGVGTTGADAA